MIRTVLAAIGGFSVLVTVFVALVLVPWSLWLERRDRRARDREELERDQAERVIKFGAMRAAGTLRLHNANALARGHDSRRSASLRPKARDESLPNVRRLRNG